MVPAQLGRAATSAGISEGCSMDVSRARAGLLGLFLACAPWPAALLTPALAQTAPTASADAVQQAGTRPPEGRPPEGQPPEGRQNVNLILSDAEDLAITRYRKQTKELIEDQGRREERRVGKEGVSTVRYGWFSYTSNNNTEDMTTGLKILTKT